MNLKLRENKGALIIEIENQVAFVHIDEIKKLIEQYVKRDYVFFIFDMTNIAELTTLEVGSIVAIYKKIKKCGVSFCLINVSKNLKDLFHISKIENIMKIYSNEEEALFDIKSKIKNNNTNIKKKLERKFKRISCNAKVIFNKSILGKILSFTGETLNISKGGIYIKTSNNFPIGTILNINLIYNISNNKKEDKINAIVRVAWIAELEKHPDHYPGMGLDIINIEKGNYRKLEKFLEVIQDKQNKKCQDME